ncbi:MAG TPA: hypothetical protein VMM15_10535, partial [Bradyrhizobium sp.]|nr:hypothetical protein [Bradyrhizobium sp.]
MWRFAGQIDAPPHRCARRIAHGMTTRRNKKFIAFRFRANVFRSWASFPLLKPLLVSSNKKEMGRLGGTL